MPKRARHRNSSSTRRPRRVGYLPLSVLTAAVLTFGMADRTFAQSFYGCEDLDRSHVPMIEGVSGSFFRIDPDLLMDTRLTTAVIESIADTSRNLASRGVRLIFVPVPTKGLVQADQLGPEADRLGFDVRLASALYADTLVQIRANGVTAVDALGAMEGATTGKHQFFQTDPRMTDDGLRTLARAIASEAGESLMGAVSFRTQRGEDVDLESSERFRLQLSCQAELPPVRTRTFKNASPSAVADHAPIAVVQSTITGGDARNFRGHLEQTLRRPITQVSVAESAYDAMTGYLTSDAFRTNRPEAIIWLVPIWQNPTLRGDQPLREIVAAAADRCDLPRETREIAPGSYGIELAAHNPTDSVKLDTGGTPISMATFRFSTSDGRTRARHVLRSDAANATPLTFMPLTGLWPDGATHVTIDVDTALTSAPKISICRG